MITIKDLKARMKIELDRYSLARRERGESKSFLDAYISTKRKVEYVETVGFSGGEDQDVEGLLLNFHQIHDCEESKLARTMVSSLENALMNARKSLRALYCLKLQLCISDGSFEKEKSRVKDE